MGSGPRLNTVTNLILSASWLWTQEDQSPRGICTVFCNSEESGQCTSEQPQEADMFRAALFSLLVLLRVVSDAFPGRSQEVCVMLTGPPPSGRCTPQLAAGIQKIPQGFLRQP